MKILNLYAGIGGNRKLWGDDHEITAVEMNESIAGVYRDYFPNDTVIVGDAHQYLLDHFSEFDFIWSSPPCQSHTRMNDVVVARGQKAPGYIDMKLYQEIIFLQKWFKGKWIVENVKPYYTPLIPPMDSSDRHYYWANFRIGKHKIDKPKGFSAVTDQHISSKEYGFDLSGYKLTNRKDQVINNCVHPQTGLYILNCAMNILTKQNVKQKDLFE